MTFYSAANRNGYMNLQDASLEDNMPSSYETTLPKDPSGNLACSWSTSDPSTYLIRGENYLRDNQKVLILCQVATNLLILYFLPLMFLSCEPVVGST